MSKNYNFNDNEVVSANEDVIVSHFFQFMDDLEHSGSLIPDNGL